MTVKKSFLRWLWDEFLRVLPAIIYFAIAFNLIRFNIGLNLNLPPGQARYFSALELTLGALIVGKVLIIANALPFINLFPHKPLIYSIVWKFFLYLLFIFILWALEAVLRIAYSFDNFYVGYSSLIDSLSSTVFLSCLLWISYTLVIYVVISEYIRVLGRQKVVRILLGGPVT
jgi:hypothetical protein